MTFPLAAIANGEAGSTVRAKLNQLVSGNSSSKNVKDFGAVGDGITDDTAGIQAAVDYADSPYSATQRGIVYFPVGIYKISAPITFVSSIRYIKFDFAPGAKIIGSVANDALLKRAVDSAFGGVYSIDNGEFENTHTTGKGILFHSAVGAKVRGCKVSAHIGIETYGSQSITIDSCDIIRSGGTTLAGSIGIMAGNATTVLNCDVTGYETGIRHYNLGLCVLGGRYEVNGTGIALGLDSTGSVFQSTSPVIAGLSMEDNDTGILLRAVASGFITASAVTSGNVSDYGIRVIGAQDTTISNINISATSGFTANGFSLEGATRLIVENVAASGSWNLATTASYILRNCDNPAIAIANLPTSPEVGERHLVTDANAPSLGSNVASGGTTDCVVEWAPSAAWKVVAI